MDRQKFEETLLNNGIIKERVCEVLKSRYPRYFSLNFIEYGVSTVKACFEVRCSCGCCYEDDYCTLTYEELFGEDNSMNKFVIRRPDGYFWNRTAGFVPNSANASSYNSAFAAQTAIDKNISLRGCYPISRSQASSIKL